MATGLQGYRATGLQGYRAIGLQGYRATGLQGYRATELGVDVTLYFTVILIVILAESDVHLSTAEVRD